MRRAPPVTVSRTGACATSSAGASTGSRPKTVRSARKPSATRPATAASPAASAAWVVQPSTACRPVSPARADAAPRGARAVASTARASWWAIGQSEPSATTAPASRRCRSRPPHRVAVGVHQPRHEPAAAQVDDLGAGAAPVAYVVRLPDGGDPPVAHGDRKGVGPVGIEGADTGAGEDEAGGGHTGSFTGAGRGGSGRRVSRRPRRRRAPRRTAGRRRGAGGAARGRAAARRGRRPGRAPRARCSRSWRRR